MFSNPRCKTTIRMDFGSFSDLWEPWLGGQGTVGAYLVGLDDEKRRLIEYHTRKAYLSVNLTVRARLLQLRGWFEARKSITSRGPKGDVLCYSRDREVIRPAASRCTGRLGGRDERRAIEKSAMTKIYMRLLPFAVLSFFLAYVNRVDVRLRRCGLCVTISRCRLRPTGSRWGHSIGPIFFEVPSNMVMEKLGARLWIARIMITWGLLACATAYVTGATSFGIVRFLLGAAEAGFFTGIILYFTYWFPSYHHARIVSGFLIGLPIAVAAGAPLSTALLGLDGFFSLRGWQIMYLAEGNPYASDRHRDLLCPHRQARAGEVPDTGRKGLATSEARCGAHRQGMGSDLHLVAEYDRSQGAAAVAQLSGHSHR